MTDVYRNVNILYELNSGTGTDLIEIYKPGFITEFDTLNNLKYAGFISSLRLTIDISSISELEVVPTQITDDSETVAEANKDTFNNNPKKCLSFFMKTSASPLTKIIDIYLFNQRPYYYLDLLPYFTNVESFDIGNDAVLSCQMRDVDYGILTGDDRVVILGSAVERASKEDNVLEVYS